MDFRAYFGPFSLVNGVKHENLSLNVNFWSITLKFFCELLQPMSLSGDKGVAQFKKSVKMGHPNGDPCVSVSRPSLSMTNIPNQLCKYAQKPYHDKW